MRTAVLVVLSFLLVNIALWANPFLGDWKVADDRYSFTDSHVEGIMDGQDYASNYTYTANIMFWRDRTWLYRFLDADHCALVGFVGPGGEPMIWVLVRYTPPFTPQKEGFSS